jgi:hypothetical protein
MQKIQHRVSFIALIITLRQINIHPSLGRTFHGTIVKAFLKYAVIPQSRIKG